MATTYEAIATVTVGSGGAASIDFTSIPATFTDLLVKLSARSNGSGGYDFQNMFVKINGATTNGSTRWLRGNGSSASSASDTPIYTTALNYPLSTSNTFNNMELYFPNYLSSNNKSISIDAVAENNATAAEAVLQAGLWSNTNAITEIGFYPNIGSFVQHSTATLYGIKNS